MTFIHPTAVIGPNVQIGEDVYIGPLCIIGYPPEYKGKEYLDAGVVIGKGTRITGAATIDSGTEHHTTIGENCYILKAAHLGHDVIIGNNVTISCKAIVGGHTVIGDHCNLGLGCIIHQKQNIAEGCMLGMGAIITKKLITEPFKTYAGNPATLIGENNKHPFYTSRLKDYP